MSVSVLAIIIREVAVERGDLGVTITKMTAAAAALVIVIVEDRST